MHRLERTTILILLIASLLFVTLAPALAQNASPAKRQRAARPAEDQAAEEAANDPEQIAQRERLNTEINREMYRLREGLIRDSISRMQNARYEQPRYQRVVENFLIFLVFATIIGAILWLIHVILENRRWSRVAKIQTDIHTKLLERMSSSQELLAYMDTEAGKRFLEASPFEMDRTSAPGFPYGRIMYPIQAGVVVLVVGVALLWLQNAIPDAAQPLLVFGTLGLALGIGLVLSAVMAYVLSRNLGLVTPAEKSARPSMSTPNVP